MPNAYPKRFEDVIRKKLGLDENQPIKPGHDIVNDYGGDSLDIAELFMDLEMEYDMNLNDEYFAFCDTSQRTVGKLAGYIKKGGSCLE